ncbi:RNA 2',3'-cyclic phosphodiesterase [Paenibacillus sp. Marseille-P2973]|uniref:RNA 2',3'-cyclic phosphodiesterase n=1 Tax=Paenibacillus TaxID=44249 RepID=UPI001B375E99|nr:RNA 2',3'-cyclic phosphodiesterase [Paenibacillus vini]MBQ4899196.1 RNA 2',3'-cyclic phosphodiesterase [Paenibacillus sp. Marseille-P2973]MDN4068592.1 RNA 2',3'-cyclic phosphodiesterase [Paenibacillus vini]
MSKIIDSWRVFIAVPLPKSIKEAISAWTEPRKSDLAFSKWVHPSDYHITVQFLGDISPTRINDLQANLESITEGQKAFELNAREVGFFGRASNPRVLWAGVEGDMEHLKALQSAVAEGNRKLGFIPEDRPYSPHITLARKYAEDRRLSPEQLSGTGSPPEFGSWTADAIVVYRTRMNKSPMYEEVGRISLLS